MKEKQIKRIAGLLSFLLAFAAFAGCGGGGSSLPSETESSADTSSDDADTESPADSSAEAPDESPWTEEPVVKSVFFSDFGKLVSRQLRLGTKWGELFKRRLYSLSWRCQQAGGDGRYHRSQFVRKLL